MNHEGFVSLIRPIHKFTVNRMNLIQKTMKKFSGGKGLSGGAYGETYESVFVQSCREKKIRIIVSPHGAVTDVYFEDYQAMLQIKTNQGGNKAISYNGGKTLHKGGTRGDAVKLYVSRVTEQFNDIYDSAKNFYLMSYNADGQIFDVYHLAEIKKNRLLFVNDFIHKAPKGYNPHSRVGHELLFSVNVLHKIYGEP